ncbi:alpha-tocopherol transfer protein-like [Coccinella septempunctata]|uniref:alpha-tocopherol transfer protein-like n=1 Tax=Coccinella septempunctata TaxID=41139 RepID=UPI001D071EC1|nr:alpha-tocopherol transfer protein-like [Coccinella septempunctata]
MKTIRCEMTLCMPDSELLALFREEFNEDLETREKYLEHMKDWLRQQPHLPKEWGDVPLLNFLRCCNFSLEKTKMKIDKYFTVKAALPEFFKDWDIKRPELVAVTEAGQACALPNLTPEGRRVMVLRGYTKNMKTPNVVHFIRIALMFGDIRINEELHGVTGDVVIFDASVLTAGHFSRAANPVLLKKFLLCVRALPVRVKEIHVVNAVSLVDVVVNWIMMFVKEKYRKLLYVHSSVETLQNYIPTYVLPEEYGGTAGSLEDFKREWIRKLDSYTDWFKEHENFKADESKRPGKPTNYDELFGLDGSFRQLTID